MIAIYGFDYLEKTQWSCLYIGVEFFLKNEWESVEKKAKGEQWVWEAEGNMYFKPDELGSEYTSVGNTFSKCSDKMDAGWLSREFEWIDSHLVEDMVNRSKTNVSEDRLGYQKRSRFS